MVAFAGKSSKAGLLLVYFRGPFGLMATEGETQLESDAKASTSADESLRVREELVHGSKWSGRAV